jgi:hypothetical protein
MLIAAHTKRTELRWRSRRTLIWQAPLEKSLQELDTLLKSAYPDWKKKCGLVLTTARDGTTEWVLPKHVDKFTEVGAAMFTDVDVD